MCVAFIYQLPACWVCGVAVGSPTYSQGIYICNRGHVVKLLRYFQEVQKDDGYNEWGASTCLGGYH